MKPLLFSLSSKIFVEWTQVRPVEYIIIGTETDKNTFMKNMLKDKIRKTVMEISIPPLLRSIESPHGKVASVIMMTRDRHSYLNLTLTSLQRQVFPKKAWEIIIVEDASKDRTTSLLDAYASVSNIELFRRKRIHRQSRLSALQEAIEQARGSIIILLSDDMLVDPGFVLRHVSRHINGPVVVIGNTQRYIHSHISERSNLTLQTISRFLCRNYAKSSRPSFPLALLTPDDLEDFNSLNPLTFGFSENERAESWFPGIVTHSETSKPSWLFFSHLNTSVSKDYLLSVGGYDPVFQDMELADIDLGLRLFHEGIPFLSEPNAIALRQLPPTMGKKSLPVGGGLSYFFQRHPELVERKNSVLFSEKHSSEKVKGLDHKRVSIVWCVRGRGLGHATRDYVLYQEIRKLAPTTQFTFVSYGSAAQWLEDHGLEVQNLGDKAGQIPRLLYDGFTKAIQEKRPDLIVSDEELLALAVAKSLGVSALYITNWLLSEDAFPDCGYIHYAQAVLFPDFPGSFSLPKEFLGKTEFFGPWVSENARRTKEVAMTDRRPVEDNPNLVITAGQGFSEDIEFVRTAIAATRQLSTPVRVTVLGGALTGEIQSLGELEGITVIGMISDTAALFREADIIITRGGHTTLWELAALGVPSIAIPRRRNRDFFLTDYALRFAVLGTSLYLPEALASEERLAYLIKQILFTPLGERMRRAASNIHFNSSRQRAASTILSAAEKVAR